MLGEDARGTTIEITVRPHAGRCRLVEATPERVRVEVSAPPEDGKATRQAIRTVAEALGVPLTSVELLKGMTSRHKTLRVSGLGTAECLERLQASVK